jgi:hypothetical protein
MATKFNRRSAESRAPILIIGALAVVFCASAVRAETPAVCRGHAEKAVNAFRENQSRDCRFANARWHDDFDAHYNWCLAAPSVWVKDEGEFRENLLLACRGDLKAVECKKYAFMASSSQTSNLSGNCGFTGARWQDNDDQDRGGPLLTSSICLGASV